MQKLEVVSKDKSMVGKSGGDILAEHLVRIKAEKAAARAKQKEDDLVRKKIDQLKEHDKRIRDYKYAVFRMFGKSFEVGEMDFTSLPIEAQKALFAKIEAIAKKRFLYEYNPIFLLLNLVSLGLFFLIRESPVRRVLYGKKCKAEAFPELFGEKKSPE